MASNRAAENEFETSHSRRATKATPSAADTRLNIFPFFLDNKFTRAHLSRKFLVLSTRLPTAA